MRCEECGVEADHQAPGWRAYRTDLPANVEFDDDETPIVVFYCANCAEQEFGLSGPIP